jgi:hypothetical protein
MPTPAATPSQMALSYYTARSYTWDSLLALPRRSETTAGVATQILVYRSSHSAAARLPKSKLWLGLKFFTYGCQEPVSMLEFVYT